MKSYNSYTRTRPSVDRTSATGDIRPSEWEMWLLTEENDGDGKDAVRDDEQGKGERPSMNTYRVQPSLVS